MPEILTESFCERCGTRYTFEAATPRKRPLTKLKIVSKGLKNYVLSDETSLDEAFADARSDEQRAISSQQLDAFHKTFNFCMSCRQYTCANCWNEVEGRCLTCAPHLGREILPGPFPVVDTRQGDLAGLGADGNGSPPGGLEPAGMIAASAWPTVDLRPASEEPSTGAVPDAAAVDVPIAATAAGPEAAGQAPPTVDERAAAAAATTTSLLGRFRPGRRPEPGPGADGEAVGDAAAMEGSEADIAAAGVVAAGAAAAGAMAVGASTPEADTPEADTGLTPEELAEISAATLAARSLRDETADRRSTQPQEHGAEPEIDAARETEAGLPPEVAAAAASTADAAVEAGSAAESTPVPPAAGDRAEAEAWSMVAPEGETPATTSPQAGADGAVSPPTPAPQVDRSDQPQWPPTPIPSEGPQWPTTTQWPPTPAGGQGDLQWPMAAMNPRPPSGAPAYAPPPTSADALWAASSRDVLDRPGAGVQACVSCGLPLSATARFCRRCGSRQG